MHNQNGRSGATGTPQI